MTTQTRAEDAQEARPLLWKRRVLPGLVVAVEDSLNIVIEAGQFERHTVTSVDAMKTALDDAKALVLFAEALYGDFPGDHERVRETIKHAWPAGDEIDD